MAGGIREDNEVQRIAITTGRDNVNDGLTLGIDGEAYPRIQLTPQGNIKTGDGLTPPVVYGAGSISSEDVRDTIAAALVQGANISIVVNDGADTITISVTGLTSAQISDFDERVQDVVAAEVVEGSNISASYNDTSGQLTISVTGLTESVQDIIGAMASGGSGLTATYNDGANTWVLDVNVDGSTLEISSDQLRIKDAGVTAAKLATGLGRNYLVADTTALNALTGLREGDMAFKQDTNEVFVYNGSAWKQMSSLDTLKTYTPALTATTTNPTNYTASGDYNINNRVDVDILVTAGSGFTVGSGSYLISLPVATTATFNYVLGTGYQLDSSGSTYYPLTVLVNNSTTAYMRRMDVGTAVTHANPLAGEINDAWVLHLRYKWF